MRTTARVRSVVGAMLAATLCGALAGCSGDEDRPGPTGGGATSGTAAPSGASVQPSQPALERWPSLAAAPETELVEVTGRIAGLTPDSPATLRVAPIRVGPSGSVLTFTVTTTQPGQVRTTAALANSDREFLPERFTLVSKGTNQRFHALCVKASQLCMASDLPRGFGPVPAQVYVAFPIIPAGIDQLQVAAPGFPAVTVPVVRS